MRKQPTMLALVVAGALSLAGVARAATYTATWVGGGSNNWNDATQWSSNPLYPNNGQPAGTDTYDVVINGGASTLALNQAVAVEVFDFNGGSISNTGFTLTVNQHSVIGAASDNTFLTGTGTLVANGGLDFRPMLDNNPPVRTSWTLDLYGANTTTGDLGWYMRNTGTMNIKAGATFEVRGDSSVTIGDGTGIINNAGTFSRTTKTTETEVQNQFNNQATGLVEVTSGSLKLTGGGTHSGDFAVSTGKTLTFGGTHTFNSGASVSGAGNATFTGPATFNSGATLTPGGNLTGNAALSVAETTTVGGDLTGSSNSFQLNGAGTVNVAGRFYWNGAAAGAPSLNGTGVLNALGGMTVSGAGNYTNNKTVNLYGDSSIDDGAGWWVTNNGTYNVQPGATLELKAVGGATDMIRGTGTINNQGTLFRAQSGVHNVLNTLNNAGTVRADAGGQFDFTGTVTQLSGSTLTGGTWHANGGTLNLPGSSLVTIGAGATVILTDAGTLNRIGTALTTVNGGFFVNGTKSFTTGAGGLTVGATGTVGGSGTIVGNLANNGGTVAPGNSPGTLTLTGNYAQATGSTLAIELAGPAQGLDYDWFDISGTADLAGTLAVNVGGPWFLDYGDTFTVLTAAGGITDNGLLLGGPDGAWFNMNVGATDVVLTSLIPEPASLALLALAGLALTGKRRTR